MTKWRQKGVYKGKRKHNCLKRKHFPKHIDQWKEIAKGLGFETVGDMLYCLYVDGRMSTRKIEKKIGFSYQTIKRKLNLLGVRLRGQNLVYRGIVKK